ncbi:hypothetical protein POF50_019765 [Streptomyces sp. SL13]|uniref:Lipoprotein n=1 Tax=Streptantibioticus silvisoli TaxID=2705255 RepID=A0AA90H6M9_9ACTN|nr:hypothetical protein [Streptantibioticus silvisoli]MDI5971539.1 hypothetical protein [Streptantibioticus silvisoli]
MSHRRVFATVLLGTAAAFLATACGPSDSGSSASSTSGVKASAAATATAATAATANAANAANAAGAAVPSSPASASDSPARSGSASTPKPAVPAAAPAATTPTAKAASPIRTQMLPDGSKAEIYKLGDEHYRADVVHDGQLFVTLETKQHDAGIDANDMFIVLTMSGDIHAWMGGGHQGPGTFKLAGGWTAKVTKIGELRYRAQILGNQGEVDATLETDQHDVGLDANAVYIVLSDGGLISAHE